MWRMILRQLYFQSLLNFFLCVVTPNVETLGLPQLQCTHGQQGQRDGNDPKADNHLGFRPALQFKMMVQRSHAKNSFAMGHFEEPDLENYR